MSKWITIVPGCEMPPCCEPVLAACGCMKVLWYDTDRAWRVPGCAGEVFPVAWLRIPPYVPAPVVVSEVPVGTWYDPATHVPVDRVDILTRDVASGIVRTGYFRDGKGYSLMNDQLDNFRWTHIPREAKR